MKLKSLILKSFKDHKGRPGFIGGSSSNSGILSLAPELRKKALIHVDNFFSSTNGITKEEMLHEVKKQVSNARVIMRVTPNVLLKILQDDKFKNQHETGTSNGDLDPQGRLYAETKAFGTPVDNDPKNFPVYGIMDIPGLIQRPDRNIDAYGDIKVVFKDSIKKRTSVTVDDSLYNFRDDKVAPSPVTNLGFECLDSIKLKDGKINCPYVEAQIHGKTTTRDIDKVVLPKSYESNLELIKRLKEANINYEFGE